ncbi:type I polyketide synthase [Streptomyces violaceusniger]|uniref:Acyl transferase n=1 Tax=Streptomyces violaceusniger (strain Tu 4113) TaxID=653045 RepID=G2P0H9_STRV4|nr:type I polyketide synthase [Streptomyces violaceusniger]AEM85977.1 Acyl transferase [Streptomyces violaceusniger Tu 4113]
MATEDKLRSYLKTAVANSREAQRQLNEIKAKRDEPLAIVGMACRYPGGVAGPDDLWELVASGTDAVSLFPADRGWDVDALYDPEGAPGTTSTREGGFVESVADFDAGFFGVSPREALAMDPQQRLMLEVSWEALEHAGIDPASLTGTATGVFVGAASSGYLEAIEGLPETESHRITSGLLSVISGRLSYTLGLEGPAVTVDTACSSSLVAMHWAGQALRSGECSLALAGGVTVAVSPAGFVEFSRQGGLAPDGRCKAFAEGADGTGWSEGAGVVVLERLSDARRNGHRVLAVVRSSAVNQDGASNGLTAPNGPSQQRVIRQALAAAGLSPAEVDVVEAHGTGTVLGDPIEAQALLSVYGQGRSGDQPLWLGSLKSNIGHSQAAAGVAGVIKMVQAMRYGTLPRTLHVDEPSTRVDWGRGRVRLLTEEQPWPETGHPRRAGVSSFGVSGTNAHLILEAASLAEDGPAAQGASDSGAGVVGGVVPWVVSGRSAAAVAGQAGRLLERVERESGLNAADVAWSLLGSRSLFDHRAVVVGAGRDELTAGLRALAAGEPAVGVAEGFAGPGRQVVFVFPGQGAQWVGMAGELRKSYPVFADALAECGDALGEFVDWSLLDALDDREMLARVDVVQPALWAVMVSLARVWQSLGVRPAAVVGHSQGEIAAAVVAGGLSLSDGARVVALRSRAIAEVLVGDGGMVAVSLPVERARELIGRWGDGLSVAAVNGPGSVVVSGVSLALDELVAHCEGVGVQARRVPVDYASHSAVVERVEQRLARDVAAVTPVSGSVPMYSTVTAGLMDTGELDAGYWYRNLRQTVLFEDANRALVEAGYSVFVEISPHPVLTMPLQDTLDTHYPGLAAEAVVTGTLRRNEGGPVRMLASAAELFVHGVPIVWDGLFAGRSPRRVDLPTYAFQRSRYWPEGGMASADVAAAGLEAVEHPLLGAVLSSPEGGGVVFTSRLSAGSQPWLADHAVQGAVVFPGTGFVELVVQAADAVGCGRVSELIVEAPLVLPERGGVQVQVVVGESEDGRRPVTVYARPDGGGEQPWLRHAGGVVEDTTVADVSGFEELAGVWPPAGAEAMVTEGIYERIAAEGGFVYGPTFQGLTRAWRQDGRVFAEVDLPEQQWGRAGAFGIHPALLDSVLHASLFADLAPTEYGRLPFSFGDVVLHASGAARVRACLTRTGPDSLSVAVTDPSGGAVLSLGSLVMRPLTPQALTAAERRDETVLAVEWTELPAEARETGDLDTVLGPVVAGPDAEVPWLPGVPVHQGLDEVRPESGRPVVLAVSAQDGPVVEAAHRCARWILEQVQSWLGDERFADSTLLVLTRGAVGAGPREAVADLAAATAWGLVRSAQAENPGRITLIDTDAATGMTAGLLAVARGTGEPQLAVRAGRLYAARLARADVGLAVPETDAWHLDSLAKGTLENLRLVPFAEGGRELGSGEVRIRVHAAGVNFRDVLNALGMYPDPDELLGSDVAGVVAEVGPGVSDLRVGDRVMGLVDGGIGSLVVCDRRLVVPVPAGWSFVTAASVPTAFLTAYYALVELAGLRAGERVLVHAGAGGVGMAAIQLARHLGAEVFSTASDGKRELLRARGLDEGHLASSRSLDFEAAFSRATGGRGVDVVLNSLTGDFIDASLRLMPGGGRFIEMGKAELRQSDEVAARYDGVRYRSFDLVEAGPERTQQMLAELVRLFETGSLEPLPVTEWDVRQAPEAFRYMSQARHVGKLVLTVRQRLVDAGTVLVTGGTGGLGGEVARHLVTAHGVRDLVLVSRRGSAAPGAGELVAELSGQGARVTVAACDVSDRDALAAVLAEIPAEHRLTGVVHTAGVVDDGLISSLTADRLGPVLAPKVDAAWHLHELTRDMDLSLFAVFSSMSGLLGAPGQGNYAAGNVFLDALIAQRRHEGLPGVSMAWGPWTPEVGLTGTLSEADMRRLERSGIPALSVAQGMRLFDQATAADVALVGLARIDTAVLRGQADLPVMLRTLVGARPRRAVAGNRRQSGGFAQQLAGLTAQQRDQHLLALVRDHVAVVLGHQSGEQVDPGLAFREAGFDSLTAVELRNRLQTATGLSLPATLVFDYPNAIRLAGYLAEQSGDATESATESATRQELPALVSVADDPIVVVGMACRYPGGVESPDDLWNLVTTGTDAMTPFPADRGWDVDGLYDPTGSRPNTAVAREGGFLTAAADFDAGFFGISPREALAMDPQQRLLLEVVWEALEHAGIDPTVLGGTPAGVFVGSYHSSYGDLVARAGDAQAQAMTGGAQSVLSGRVSYVLGLEGPAVTVDTACSSSLVAMHLAGQSLRAGESSLALAGGVTVLADPGTFVEFSRQGGLAGDGRCKAFAESADGTGFGEGIGIVVLERLSDARRNGHRVLAVMRSSAINQDGASNGLTAPNGPSQQRVIRQALAAAGLAPTDIDAVEAHGTGTTLGDPIEAHALLSTYGQGRPEDQPLWLGTVKSNIGHTQAAAGVAGAIKMVHAMRHGVLPRTLYADQPTSHVDWSQGRVRLLTEEQPWPETGHPRRAGVSSFGISGTNAHVILEAAPDLGTEPEPETGAAAGGDAVAETVWVVSGRSAQALAAQAGRLLERVQADPGLTDAEVGRALLSTRSLFEHRAVVVGAGRDGLTAGLRALAAGEPAADVVDGVARTRRGTAVLFTGQGAQRLGMGRLLHEQSPVFAAAFDEVADELDRHLDGRLRDVLWGEDRELLDRTGWTQPALFAIEVALFRVLRSWGIEPDYLLGHSIGEVAAAHVAGVFSLPDACRLVAARARLMEALPAGGAMAAVAATEEEVTARLADGVSIAAVNAAESVVVAGPEDAVTAVAEHFAALGRRTRRLRVSHAFHSALMDPMLDDFAAELEQLTFAETAIPVVSNMTGAPADMAHPKYWVEQVRSTVRFADGLRWLAERGVDTFVEAGPDAVLSRLVELNGLSQATAVALQRGDRTGRPVLLHALAQLFVRGVPVDWDGLFAGRGTRRVDLPTYAFRRRRYWPQAAPERATGRDPVDALFWESVEGGAGQLARSLGVADDALSDVAPALLRWRERRLQDAVADDWCYRQQWVPVDGVRPDPAAPQRWLAIVPEGDDPWATAVLEALGPDVTVLAPDAADAEQLAPAGADRTGVVSLAAADEAGVEATLRLVQELRGSELTVPLWVLTRAAITARPGEQVKDVWQGGVWGLGRVAALELPGLWGGLVDLPEDPDPAALKRLAGVLVGGHGEDQLAVRASGVLARRLVRAPGRGTGEPWRTSGTALVTGGTGGLGGYVARWLVERGAEHVVLMSRRGPDAPGAAGLQAELESSGAKVSVLAGDVADRAAMTQVLAGIPADLPLRTVVHTAGVLHRPLPVEALPVATLHDSLGAKVKGALLLDELTAGMELDAFVLFSSGASSWGGSGQGGYAAGNACLDSLAEYRRARGRTATSIAWGTWAEAGMAAANTGEHDYLVRLGVLPMQPEPAIAAMQRVLEDDATTVTVSDMDWAKFAPAFSLARPSRLFALLQEAGPAVVEPEADREATAFAERVAAMPADERREHLLALVQEHAAAVLGHSSGDELDPETAFRDAGFDSLTAVELRNGLQTMTGLTLPATLVFDYPNPVKLADLLESMVGGPSGDADEEIRRKLLSVPLIKLRDAGLLDAVLALADDDLGPAAAPEDDETGDETDLMTADADDLVRIALEAAGGAPTT